MKGNLLIVGNVGAGSERLRDLICDFVGKDQVDVLQLDARAYTDQERAVANKSISSTTWVIHVQKGYRELLLSPFQEDLSGCSQTLKFFYENDLWAFSLRERSKKYMALDALETAEQLKDLLSWMEIPVSWYEVRQSAYTLVQDQFFIKENTKSLNSPQLSRLLEAYEGLLNRLYHLSFLNSCTVQNILYTEDDLQAAPVLDLEVSEHCKPVTIFLDVAPNAEFLKAFILSTSLRKEHRSVILIFSHKQVVEPLVSDCKYRMAIKKGIMKIWHVSEWEECLEKEFKNLRNPLYFCKSIVSSPSHREYTRLQEFIKCRRTRYLQQCEEACMQMQEYYTSTGFEKRLDAIAQGKSPRVYLQRPCHTVAVKQFIDNMAEELRHLGCEVFVHPPCDVGKVDFVSTSILEINEFKPDFLVETPNYYLSEIDGYQRAALPRLYSLQDIRPHKTFLSQLDQQPMRGLDILYTLVPRFSEKILQSGLLEEQFLCDYLPVERGKISKSFLNLEPRFDVGYVKSMTPHNRLRDLVKAKTAEEKNLADLVQGEIIQKVKKGEVDPLDEVVHWKNGLLWEQEFINCYHYEFVLHFIRKLKKSNVSIGLSGSNWEKIPGLRSDALGHAESREDYQLRFLENKINLSMDAWAEYHPRIFEGGILGAFFLVFKPQEGMSVHDLPSEMRAGEHFDFFVDEKDLLQKCQYYLKRPEKRKEIGKNLQSFLKKRFSYANFCEEVLIRFRSLIKKRVYSGL